MGMTTYVVTGYVRSGTSAMMRALSKGGLPPAYDPQREAGGELLMEPSWEDAFAGDFPATFDDRLVKALLTYSNWPWPVHDYKVIVMVREPDVVWNSFDRAFNDTPQVPKARYKDMIRRAWHSFQSRDDVDAVMTHFDGLKSSPHSVFQMLADKGWPINVDAASAIIQPALSRST